MRDSLQITEITFTAAEPSLVATGLLGWSAFSIAGGLRIEVAVRRTRDARTVLSFPTRSARSGGRRPLVNPTHSEARRAIEEQVLGALRAQGVIR